MFLSKYLSFSSSSERSGSGMRPRNSLNKNEKPLAGAQSFLKAFNQINITITGKRYCLKWRRLASKKLSLKLTPYSAQISNKTLPAQGLDVFLLL